MTEWQNITDYLYDKLKEHSRNKLRIPNFNTEKLVFKGTRVIDDDTQFAQSFSTDKLRTFEHIVNNNDKKIKRNLYKPSHKQYRFDTFKELNKMHTEYLSGLFTATNKGMNKKQIISKMELTGAKMQHKGTDFIVCEERKNIIYGITKDSSIKMFIKKNNIFKFVFKEEVFYLMGENIKLKRLCLK
ncbi:hypothetical protein CDIK_2393 [Cucumispora dikerogammari]|nr:hypothetical protein CDIK_2393 [Cucumispora dikerogammari]